jgi:SNF2 family DNA or RNA helicase
LPSSHRLALTGTLIQNKLGDLWSVFNWIFDENPLGGFSEFQQDFQKPIEKVFLLNLFFLDLFVGIAEGCY